MAEEIIIICHSTETENRLNKCRKKSFSYDYNKINTKTEAADLYIDKSSLTRRLYLGLWLQ